MPDSSDPTPTAVRARKRILGPHYETVATVLRCADAVAESWDGESTADPAAVADPLRTELDAAGAWRRLPDVLADAVDATGESLPAPPVADPPYVAATSRGPVLRATLGDGRLVVLLRAFVIERAPNNQSRYRRGPRTPADAVAVSVE